MIFKFYLFLHLALQRCLFVVEGLSLLAPEITPAGHLSAGLSHPCAPAVWGSGEGWMRHPVTVIPQILQLNGTNDQIGVDE